RRHGSRDDGGLVQAAAHRLVVLPVPALGERHSAPRLGRGVRLRALADLRERQARAHRERRRDRAVRFLHRLLEGRRVSLVTPLNRVLGLGTAKGAAEHWWVQRVTAVALVPLALWFAIALATLPDFSYATVVDWMQRPVTSVLLVLFVLAAGYHSYLGVQVVIEDYVHAKGAKAALVVTSTLAHAALTVAAVFAVLKVA